MKKLIFKTAKLLKNIFVAIKHDIYFVYNKTYFLSQEEVERREINYKYKGRTYKVKLPVIEPEKEVNIRLKKIKPNGKDLILKLFYNKGTKQYIEHWVDKNALNKGYMGMVNIEGRAIDFSINNSNPYTDIVLKNKGNLPILSTFFYMDRRYRGDVIIKLMSYNTDIISSHAVMYNMTSQCLKEENKIFEKASAILKREYDLAQQVWKTHKMVHVNKVVEAYNHKGVEGVFYLLKSYLKIRYHVKLSICNAINEPGRCLCKITKSTLRDNYSNITSTKTYYSDYEIMINQKYINNPFFVASILAHELCHIVYNTYLAETENGSTGFYYRNSWGVDDSTTEMEQTVDVLTFVLGLGEFRIRAKGYGVYMGYLQEPIFNNLFHFANNNVKELFNN